MKVSESRREMMEQAKRRKVEAMRRKMYADYPPGPPRAESTEPGATAGGPLPAPRC